MRTLVVFLLLFHLCHHIHCDCPRVSQLKMTEEGRFCTESSSMGDMTCQNAWDDDIVTDTIWHPGSSGLDEYTTIYVNRKIIITKVTVKQYKWETGYASKMSLNINGDIKKMRPVNKNDFEIMEYSPILPVTTSSVQLVITAVGPGKGSAFGGIVAIKIFGCYQQEEEEEKEEEEKKKKNGRSPGLRTATHEAEMDWEEYDDGDSERRETDEIWETNASNQDDHNKDSEEINGESQEDADWHIFGRFGSDQENGIFERREAARQEEELVVQEERLGESNWPTFESRIVDEDYDEPSLQKSVTMKLSSSNRPLYIISGVVLVISIVLVSVILVYGFKARKV